MADDKGLTRPIIGIDFRTPQEVFDIMMDRIRAAPVARDGWQTSGSLGELSKEERIALDAGMNQWKRSLQRPDMQEKDRVLGAIEAVLRQMFVFSLPAPTAGQHTGEDGK